MRPSRDERDRGHVGDILEWCGQIRDLLRGKKLTDYVAEPFLRAATERWIELIGEASKQLSPELRESVQGVDWEEVAGMRDFLAHQYAKIDDLVVWNTAKTGVPDLAKALRLRLKKRT